MLGIALIWFVLEVVFAVAHVGEDFNQQLQPYTGFGRLPGKHYVYRALGFSNNVFNEYGVRNWEPAAKAPGTSRIIMLGDSVTEAVHYPNEITFSKLLEKSLNKEAGNRKFEILNCGASAYGTLQEYYQYILKLRQLKADTVVICYHQGDADDNYAKTIIETVPRPYLSHDLSGNLVTDWAFYRWFLDENKPYQVLNPLRDKSRAFEVCYNIESNLMYTNSAYASVRASVLKTSGKIARSVSKWRTRHGAQPALKQDVPPKPLSDQIICSKQELQELEPLVRSKLTAKSTGLTGLSEWGMVIKWNEDRLLTNCGVLHALVRECRKDGCRIVFVGLPAPIPDNGVFKRQMNAYERLARREGFKIIDTNRVFESVNPEQRSELVLPDGEHLTAKGHELVAAAIASEFAKE